jgi:hypothetical protein
LTYLHTVNTDIDALKRQNITSYCAGRLNDVSTVDMSISASPALSVTARAASQILYLSTLLQMNKSCRYKRETPSLGYIDMAPSDALAELALASIERGSLEAYFARCQPASRFLVQKLTRLRFPML